MLRSAKVYVFLKKKKRSTGIEVRMEGHGQFMKRGLFLSRHLRAAGEVCCIREGIGIAVRGQLEATAGGSETTAGCNFVDNITE